jgi:hypothetical protein
VDGVGDNVDRALRTLRTLRHSLALSISRLVGRAFPSRKSSENAIRLRACGVLDDNLSVGARHIVLSVLFFREPSDPDTWVAQALERDVAAHGKSIEQAKLAFERTIAGYLRLAAKHHQEPLAMLKPAPEPFWLAWERATGKKTLELPSPDAAIPPAYVIQAITNESISAAH